MRRRAFLAGVAAGTFAPLRYAIAQGSRRPVIGILIFANPEPALGLLREALAGIGFRDGETARLEIRVANGSEARLSEMAADLVARNVDVLVASTTPAVKAAKSATVTIPIVMFGAADPVGSGLVASLAAPGGNITGISAAIAELAGKLLGVVRDALPAAKRIGLLVNTTDPFYRRLIEQVELANTLVKLDLRTFGVTGSDEIETRMIEMMAQGIEAAIIQPTLPQDLVISLARPRKLPTASPIYGYAARGGLLSYSGNFRETVAVTVQQIDRILKGEKPGNLPVQQPTKFELVLNLQTAKTFGLSIPLSVLAQADEVIE